MGETDPIDRPDPDPADAAGGVSHEGGAGSPAGPDRSRRADTADGWRGAAE